jgi:hypothetical protein
MPDEYGAVADYATMSPGSPNFTAQTGTAGVLNGQPYWKTTALDHGFMTTGTWAKTPPSTALSEVIIIFQPIPTYPQLSMFMNGPISGVQGFVYTHTDGTLRTQGWVGGGPSPTNNAPNAMRWTRSTVAGSGGANAYMRLNATTPFASLANHYYGIPSSQGVMLNSYYAGTNNYSFQGAIAFLGIYDGNLASHAQWSNLKAWALSHYGATLT